MDEIFINYDDRKIFEISPNHFKFWKKFDERSGHLRRTYVHVCLHHLQAIFPQKTFLWKEEFRKIQVKKYDGE